MLSPVSSATVSAVVPPPVSSKIPVGLPLPSPLRNASSSALDKALPNFSII